MILYPTLRAITRFHNLHYPLPKGYEFLTITATDADNLNTDNADIRYSIVSQIPAEPHPNIFEINPVSGVIRVNADGLDREVSTQIIFLQLLS